MAALVAAHTLFATHTVADAQALLQQVDAAPFVAPPANAVPIPSKQATQSPSGPSLAVACKAPLALAQFDRPLVRTMRRLAGGKPLTVVAIGSSSTAGAGASSPDASYPSRLAVDLRQRFPDREITVLNRGINGEETDQMMARFGTDVIAAHPQLVLWQVGTNSVLRDRPLGRHQTELHQGVDELKNTGADVVLIDPQFSPAVIAKPETAGMVEQIALAGKEENVDVFQRFAVMRGWHEAEHLSFDTFVAPDHLHMNDWGYACWAKLLAGAIGEAATRPIASAAAHAAPVSDLH